MSPTELNNIAIFLYLMAWILFSVGQFFPTLMRKENVMNGFYIMLNFFLPVDMRIFDGLSK
jgi:hypothetical protein